jgi:hypothetical protein
LIEILVNRLPGRTSDRLGREAEEEFAERISKPKAQVTTPDGPSAGAKPPDSTPQVPSEPPPVSPRAPDPDATARTTTDAQGTPPPTKQKRTKRRDLSEAGIDKLRRARTPGWHKIGDYEFLIDDLGRTTKVRGRLNLQKAARDPRLQKAVGRVGATGDEGGHLIAARLGGPSDVANLVPQNVNFNRGAWKKMENELARELRSKAEVDVEIDLVYGDGGLRPTRFSVSAEIKRPGSTEIENVDFVFGNAPGGAR